MRVFDNVWEMEKIKLSELIEMTIPCTSPQAFTLTKNYTIKHDLETTKGKWPEQLGNGFYIESKYLLDDLLEMMRDSVLRDLKESNHYYNMKTTLDEMIVLMQKYTATDDFINQYAMQVLGKLEGRDEEYVYHQGLRGGYFSRGMLRIMSKISAFMFHLQKFDISRSAPISDLLEKCLQLEFQINTVMFTVTFFLFIIDSIVIYSMIMTDVEERTYEFAMLRCLGFKSSSLITLITVQSLLYAIPATALGFVLLYIFNSGAQLLLYMYFEISIQVYLQDSTFVLGFAIGVILPLMANILPIKQAMNHSLRDSLDRSRQGIDEVEVQCVRLENKGVNYSQVSLGLAILLVSYLTLVYIPQAFADVLFEVAYFRVNLLFLCVMVGIIFCSSGFAPTISKLYLNLVFLFMPRDRLLKPLVIKNLENHGQKNMKANLMYCFTITFLVYLSTNFMSTQKYLSQMADILFGADINIRSLSEGAVTLLDESKISEAIQPLLHTNGGMVANYTMLSSSLTLQMETPGREEVRDYVLGTGFIKDKSAIDNLSLQAIEPSSLDTLAT